MNKNTSALIVTSALLIMMGVGCSQTSRVVDFNKNTVGDEIVGLTIESIKPASDSLPLSGDNMRVKFSGDVTVAGFYDNDSQAIGMIPLNCFTVSDPAEKQRLPALMGLDQQDSFFCFNNLDEAKKAFGSATGKIPATITIRNLELWAVPTSATNTADFVKIASPLPKSSSLDNASEVARLPGTISKTFESEKGEFSYTLHWSPTLNTLSGTSLPEASEHAPSFNIVGGGTITVATGWIDSPGYTMADFVNDTYYNGDDVFSSTEPTPASAGTTYPVYYFERTQKENNSTCRVKYAVIKDLNEALAVRMENCTGSDKTAISAFTDIYSDLEIVSK